MSIFRCHKKRQSILDPILIFFILGGFFVFANNLLAMEYGGIGGRPAYPRSDNPRTESIFIHTLDPGEIQEEGVLLVNNTDEEKTLLVYAVDSVVSSGGAFACRQMAEPKKDVGTWINLEESEVTLGSGTNKIVPFTITIPQNASIGEHNGCIVIQEKKEKTKDQVGMILSFRTGLRVAITIPGEITKKLQIIGFKVESQKNGNYLLRPSVKNSGNVSIDADIKVITRNLFGSIYIEHGGQFPILRDQISDWNFELKKPFWGGWYKSNLIVEYEKDLEVEIGKETGKRKSKLESSSVCFFSMPQAAALSIEITVILLFSFFIFLFWLSKRRKRWIKKNWVEYTVKFNENINSLAKRFDVSWKLLVKVNKLKPPYTIKAGQKIKTPPNNK